MPEQIGTEFDDVIEGTEADDVLKGLGGNDTIFGRGGSDEIFGGDGDDILIGGPGNDTLDGGEGTDFAVYVNEDAGVTVDLVAGVATKGLESDTLRSIENVIGSNYDDMLSGTAGDNVLSGRGGNDIVDGGEGSDRVFGGDGEDLLYGGGGDDVLGGGDGADQLRGGDGADLLLGDGGDDALYGENGDDTLIGGAGADRFMIGIDSGNDTILDFDSSDEIVFDEALGIESMRDLTITDTSEGALVSWGDGSDSLLFADVSAAELSPFDFGLRPPIPDNVPEGVGPPSNPGGGGGRPSRAAAETETELESEGSDATLQNVFRSIEQSAEMDALIDHYSTDTRVAPSLTNGAIDNSSILEVQISYQSTAFGVPLESGIEQMAVDSQAL
ncbi:hypothetical protein [Altererythrobacter sp. MF3-039]|uniref:calcium-binding protein n=1 Tax=Altererythrobacter sp. MF3-039 TaxID=3252901 RepID=UPI00390C6B9D